MMRRRSFLSLLGAVGLLPLQTTVAPASASGVTLLDAELELTGDWHGSATGDVAVVIERARAACLAGVSLLSDRQPEVLRVENRYGDHPSIWLQAGAPQRAWIIVGVGARDWSRLAYQFGHELGHVLCNSWQVDALPRTPSQWIEEALVEAFSLRGLDLLADAWERKPPFPGDSGFAGAIRDYRAGVEDSHHEVAREQGIKAGPGAWFRGREAYLEQHGGMDAARGAVGTMLDLLMSDEAAIADLGALNRWPGRSGVPLPDYLDFWQVSCADLAAPGRLPLRLRQLLLDG